MLWKDTTEIPKSHLLLYLCLSQIKHQLKLNDQILSFQMLLF